MANLKERYVSMLLELSEENSTLELDLEQVVLIHDALKEADVQAFLENKHIPDAAKKQLLQKTFSGKIAKHLLDFLHLMIQENQGSLIVPGLTEYINRTNKSLGRIKAKVVSAKALTEQQMESIQIALSKKTGMQVEMKVEVDPNVIGGFYILIDGHIFDGTVRSRLNIMRERLKRGRLNVSESR